MAHEETSIPSPDLNAIAISPAAPDWAVAEQRADAADASKGDCDRPIERLRRLVRDKTRFEPDDISAFEHEIRQPFEVRSMHRLFSRLVEQPINGLFSPRATDREATYPSGAASDDSAARLQAASNHLLLRLETPDTSYDAVAIGLYLPAAVRHWHLDMCLPCVGKGRTDCRTCHGRQIESCWSCSGGLYVICDAYSCNGTGRINCAFCGGSGQVSNLVSYQITETIYVNGSAQTNYRTDYRNEIHACTAAGCQGGKSFCYRCTGTGRVNCSVCHATGKISCRECSGVGHHVCQPCAGSGRVGTSAWIEVHDEPAHLLAWPEHADPAAESIGDAAGLPNVVVEAGGVMLEDLVRAHDDDSLCIAARYRGALPIFRVDADCGGRSFRLVAYGQSQTWHTLDGIVESLLQRDLDALGAALMRAHDEEFWSARLDALLPVLKNVTASELNAELVEAALGEGLRPEHAAVVTDEYARVLQSGLLGSLRLIYTRSAVQQWWRIGLGTAATVLAVWSFSNVSTSVVAGLLCAPVGYWWLNRRIRAALVNALGSAASAQRAMAVAVKAKRHYVGTAIVTAPVLVATLALAIALPHRAPWKRDTRTEFAARAAGPVAKPSQNDADSAQAAAVTSTQLGAGPALALRDAGRPVEARTMLHAGVEAGDSRSLGPYAWMLLTNEGAAAGAPKAKDADVQALVRRALAANPADPWAMATHGMMLAEGWGMRRDLDAGLRSLTSAADAGVGPAMHALGMYYVNVKRQPQQARHWFGRAAALGQPEDQYNLGLMEWRGEASPRLDRAHAMELWKQAAAKGEQRAVRAVALRRPPN